MMLSQNLVFKDRNKTQQPPNLWNVQLESNKSLSAGRIKRFSAGNNDRRWIEWGKGGSNISIWSIVAKRIITEKSQVVVVLLLVWPCIAWKYCYAKEHYYHLQKINRAPIHLDSRWRRTTNVFNIFLTILCVTFLRERIKLKGKRREKEKRSEIKYSIVDKNEKRRLCIGMREHRLV